MVGDFHAEHGVLVMSLMGERQKAQSLSVIREHRMGIGPLLKRRRGSPSCLRAFPCAFVLRALRALLERLFVALTTLRRSQRGLWLRNPLG